MIFRALDANGDWQYGQGIQSFLTAENAIALNIQTALYCFLNDAFWAMDFGVDWWNLLGAKGANAQQNIILQTRAIIANCYGVVKINSVFASLDSATRKLRLSYNIDTNYSQSQSGSVLLP